MASLHRRPMVLAKQWWNQLQTEYPASPATCVQTGGRRDFLQCQAGPARSKPFSYSVIDS